MPNTVSSARTHLLTELGYEKPDPTPMEPPIGYNKQPTMMERVREMIRNEVSMRARNMEAESFEEADDFDTGEDDIDPYSPYEEGFEPVVRDSEIPATVAAALTPALAPEPSSPGGASPASAASPDAGAAGSRTKS